MEKRIMIIFFAVISLFCVILSISHKTNLYKEIQQEIKSENWASAKTKLADLGRYKDSEELSQVVNYNFYLSMGDENNQKKDYKLALDFYKKAFAIKADNAIEQKILKTEVLAHQQELEEVRIKAEQEEQKRINAVKQKIDKSAITPIPTTYGKGYDKTINRYGVANIRKINALMPKAAELIAENPSCYKVLDVDVSDERSTKNSIVMYVDCGNMNSFSNFERFYISENDINQRNQAISVREEMDKNKGLYLNACQAEIKSRLIHPSTYKTNLLTNSAVEAQSFQTVVNIDFKAKNNYNLEIPYNAICRYNVKNQLVDISIKEQSK